MVGRPKKDITAGTSTVEKQLAEQKAFALDLLEKLKRIEENQGKTSLTADEAENKGGMRIRVGTYSCEENGETKQYIVKSFRMEKNEILPGPNGQDIVNQTIEVVLEGKDGNTKTIHLGKENGYRDIRLIKENPIVVDVLDDESKVKLESIQATKIKYRSTDGGAKRKFIEDDGPRSYSKKYETLAFEWEGMVREIEPKYVNL